MTTGSPTPTKTPDAQTDPAQVRIEIEFDMLTQRLVMHSKSPTVIVGALLKKAQDAKDVQAIPERAPGAPRLIVIEYDLAKGGAPRVSTDASDIIFTGILVMAHSMMTQSQITQRLQASATRIVKP